MAPTFDGKQKRDVIIAVLNADPEMSGLKLAEDIGVSKTAVYAYRKKLVQAFGEDVLPISERSTNIETENAPEPTKPMKDHIAEYIVERLGQEGTSKLKDMWTGFVESQPEIAKDTSYKYFSTVPGELARAGKIADGGLGKWNSLDYQEEVEEVKETTEKNEKTEEVAIKKENATENSVRIPPVLPGQKVKLTITSVGEKGDGIAYVNDFVVFVAGAKPGDKVDAKIEKVFKSFGVAAVQ